MADQEPKCTPVSALVFIIALTAGTGCTVAAKSIFGLTGVGITGEVEHFRPPLFLTLMMFFGMAFALPAHFLKQAYRRRVARTDMDEAAKLAAEPVVTAKTYMLLAVPALFDLLATALMTAGLLSVDASVWQLLRGSAIILVAVMKHFVLLDHLTRAQWMGVLIITVATALVGASSLLGGKEDKAETSVPTGSPLVGVALTLGGVAMTALQYVYEEKVMSGDVQAPPWLLIGMEGGCGVLLCVFVLYPLAYLCPGGDHGSFEHPGNTLHVLFSSSTAMLLVFVYSAQIFILNALSVLITFMMSSVWHAILDSFRPVSVWLCELALFYVVSSGRDGEAWTLGSWLQLGGMLVLLSGTAVYNGSIKLPGFDAQRLLTKDSLKYKSSPALTRSPLLASATVASSPTGAKQRSPYARPSSQLPLRGPMERGTADLGEDLLMRHRGGK